jgi:hypothetical protein
MPRKKQAVVEQPALKAKPGCCEEASTLSHKFYIPCNQPAVTIVGWQGRNEKPIRMCAMCENHNIKNRGGYRVEAFTGTEPPPAHIQQGGQVHPSDDALIAENFTLEDQIKAATAKFDEWAMPRKMRIAEIEGEISRRLLERKADSTKTDSGTAYFSDIMNTKIVDSAALFDYIADRWDEFGADVKLNLPIGTVRQHMDNNEGKLPPGMTHSFWKRLNIKRS